MREDLPMAGEVLSCHRENGPRPFNSIYDAPEFVAEREKQGEGEKPLPSAGGSGRKGVLS